jgi:tRNA (guanine37-N1)-methyltransferase
MMVDAVKASLKEAEKVKQYLLKMDNLSHDYVPLKKEGFLYFAVVSSQKVKKQYTIVDIALQKKKARQTNLRQLVNLTKEENAFLKTAFDTVGEIAILEIPEELRQKEKEIGQALLSISPSIKTVLRKEGIHSGVFRTQKMKWIAGKRTKEALHKEHGIQLKLDVEKVYFSPRISTERKRIYQLVKKKEKVLVMFSGCGVYPVVISKNTGAEEIVGVEINPEGHAYGLENVRLNKCKNITLFEGDVRTIVPALDEKFDRIIMPLPKLAVEFLDVALSVAKKGCVIHCYGFAEEGAFDRIKKKVTDACQEVSRKCRILRVVKCGQYSPRVFRVCVDIVVS